VPEDLFLSTEICYEGVGGRFPDQDAMKNLVTRSSQWADPHHKEGFMQPRPTIALILRAFVYATCQFFAYKAYGVPILVTVWAVIIIGTWIDIKTTTAKVAQTVVQTAWLAFILGVIHMNQIAI